VLRAERNGLYSRSRRAEEGRAARRRHDASKVRQTAVRRDGGAAGRTVRQCVCCGCYEATSLRTGASKVLAGCCDARKRVQ